MLRGLLVHPLFSTSSMSGWSPSPVRVRRASSRRLMEVRSCVGYGTKAINSPLTRAMPPSCGSLATIRCNFVVFI
ncbi:hypothetical protein D9M68_641880 [compost metagenome]